LKLLVLQWQADPPPAPIVKINLAAEAALPRVSQGALFSPICPDPEKVELTVARLAKLVGPSNLGSPELLDTHRPESFQMRRFFPKAASAEPRRQVRGTPRSQDVPAKVEAAKDKDLKTAFRVFRPALPARVEVRKGCPARLSFHGVRGRVVAASGPWRGSGDWWREDAWQSDEWDLEIQIESGARSRSAAGVVHGSSESPRRGIYRVCFDLNRKEWFVRGAYD
jgi:protein ImuB